MQIPPSSALVNLMATLPVQGAAATGPAATPQALSPAAKAAQAALAAKQAQSAPPNTPQPAMQQVPAMTADAHRAVANLPRGSFLNIVV